MTTAPVRPFRSPGDRLRSLLVALLALVLLASACGSDSEEAETSSDFDEPAAMEDASGAGEVAAEEPMEEIEAEAMADEERAVDTGGDDGSALDDSAAIPTDLTAAELGRQIIFTADIVLEVDDVAAAGRQATEIIVGLGGFVFGQQTEGGARPQSVLIFKVLPEDFDEAVNALGSVGDLRNQLISADDVTERVVDLETRIEVAELGVERLRTTLTTTQDLEDYAEIERLLLERETELEIMRGQLRTLQDRIDLATITLTLLQDAVNHAIEMEASVYHTQDGGVSCPGTDDPTVEAGTDLTLCLEILNSGEEPVADIALIDTALGIDSADQLIAVYGELDRLEAGQSVMLAFEFTPDRTVRLRPKATARPITDEGEPAGPSVDASLQGSINVFEPEGDPGFFDGFDAGVSVLQAVWTGIKVVVGFLLPMLVLLVVLAPLGWLAGRGLSRRRRRAEHQDERPAQKPASQPPPPRPPEPEESNQG